MHGGHLKIYEDEVWYNFWSYIKLRLMRKQSVFSNS